MEKEHRMVAIPRSKGERNAEVEEGSESKREWWWEKREL